MGNRIIGVWESDYDEYGEYKPLVYANGSWHKAVFPYVYDESQWKPIGQAGTLMIPFMTSDGEYFYTSDGKMFLVRNHHNLNTYDIVSCTVTTMPTKTIYEVGETFNPAGMIIQVQYQNKGKTITRLVADYTYSTSPLTLNDNNITIHCLLAKGQSENVTVPITIREPYNANANMRYESNNTFTLHVNSYAACWDGTLQYSTDGYTWTTWDGTTTISAGLFENKYTIMLRGLNNTTLTGESISQGTFGEQDYTLMISPNSAATNVSLHGDLSALLNYQNKPTTIPTDFCFGGLFAAQEAITQANQLVLPFTTLTESCYEGMFYGCSNLINAPALPATTMVDYCYNSMFDGCESLTTPPALPATTLAPNCYEWMFEDCTSLTSAPTLSATTMMPNCYKGMFHGCTSLTTPPQLPATTLANYCYASMFEGCSALTSIPELQATTLYAGCYNGMFKGCTSLITPCELPVTTLAANCYRNMFQNCTSIKLSTTQTDEYTLPYRIPSSGTGTDAATSGLTDMFTNTGGTFTGTPTINTTYYIPYPPEEMEDMYIKFSSPNAFSLSINNAPAQHTWDGALYTSIDLNTWTEWDGTTSIIASQNDSEYVIYINGIGNTRITNTGTTTAYEFKLTGSNITVEGNIATLLDWPTVAANSLPTMGTYAFSSLFYNSSNIIDTSKLILPYMTLTNNCYHRMFYGCSSLTLAPELPANTLAVNCYEQMFYGCTSLTAAPELPATTLASECYAGMFMGCSSLIIGPSVLPGTQLQSNSYYRMFRNCSSLIKAPQILATGIATGATRCCLGMFDGCTSLVYAPDELSAPVLTDECYRTMFKDCTSLINAPRILATTVYKWSYREMFAGCISLVLPPIMSSNVTFAGTDCYNQMFSGCTSLMTTIEQPTNGSPSKGYVSMYENCTSLTTPPIITFTTVRSTDYTSMCKGCTSIKLSTTQTGIYQIPYCIPITGNGTISNATIIGDMFTNTGGTFTGSPEINTTYYIPDTNYVTFSSPNSFTLQTTDGVSHWDGTLQYSIDQITWTTWSGSQINSTLDNGKQIIYIRGIGNTRITNNGSIFTSTGSIAAYGFKFIGSNISISGNIATLLDWSTVANNSLPTMNTYGFVSLFKGNSNIINASKLILPYMTLTTGCYYQMFMNCSSLTSTPILQATTLATNCYTMMFYGCTSLVYATSLPATTLASYCYDRMFSGCSSLILTPNLPATTLANYCYTDMFRGCSSLTIVSTLPATTLTSYCYDYMFQNCTSLTTAPTLPATTLANACYNGMFDGCSSLTTIPKLPVTTLAEICYQRMFYGCTALTSLPELPATTLVRQCYNRMFWGCSNIKLSTTQTSTYQLPYRIPIEGTGIDATNTLTEMFLRTGGTFKGTPEINTTYYLSNTNSIVPAT